MAPENNNLLTLEKLQKTLVYHRSLESQVKDRLAELAVKMGVDPNTDLVVVPSRWIERNGFKVWPEWMAPGKTNEVYVIKLCRRKTRED